METELLKKEDILRRLAIAFRHNRAAYRDLRNCGMLADAKKFKYVIAGILMAAEVLGITPEELEQVELSYEEAAAFMDEVLSRTIAREEAKAKYREW